MSVSSVAKSVSTQSLRSIQAILSPIGFTFIIKVRKRVDYGMIILFMFILYVYVVFCNQ